MSQLTIEQVVRDLLLEQLELADDQLDSGSVEYVAALFDGSLNDQQLERADLLMQLSPVIGELTGVTSKSKLEPLTQLVASRIDQRIDQLRAVRHALSQSTVDQLSPPHSPDSTPPPAWWASDSLHSQSDPSSSSSSSSSSSDSASGSCQNFTVWYDQFLERTCDPDPRQRRAALRELCPCHVQRDVERFWQRVMQMWNDPDPSVRYQVLHNLCDGSPAARETEVVHVIEKLHNDPDPWIRKQTRRVLSSYRRTGRWNVL